MVNWGIALFLAHVDGDLGAVLADDLAVHGQGDGGPLIFLDAAVVVGLQQGHLAGFIQGDGLQVDAGAVDVGRGNAHTPLHALFANNRQAQCLAPVVVVHLVPGWYIFMGRRARSRRLRRPARPR